MPKMKLQYFLARVARPLHGKSIPDDFDVDIVRSLRDDPDYGSDWILANVPDKWFGEDTSPTEKSLQALRERIASVQRDRSGHPKTCPPRFRGQPLELRNYVILRARSFRGGIAELRSVYHDFRGNGYLPLQHLPHFVEGNEGKFVADGYEGGEKTLQKSLQQADDAAVADDHHSPFASLLNKDGEAAAHSPGPNADLEFDAIEPPVSNRAGVSQKNTALNIYEDPEDVIDRSMYEEPEVSQEDTSLKQQTNPKQALAPEDIENKPPDTSFFSTAYQYADEEHGYYTNFLRTNFDSDGNWL